MLKRLTISRACLAILLSVPVEPLAAGCLIDRSGPGDHGVLKVHLHPECTAADRESHALQASAILDALTRGQAIDLVGVLLRGDLDLGTLPVVTDRPPPIDGVIDGREQHVRVVAGALSIMNAVVQGSVVHRSADGTLVFSGPVTFTGTTFEQIVDLSRSVFTQPVVLSGAVFLAQGYFVQARFLREVTAVKTAFGPHTRFHRSHFEAPVTLEQSGFSGMAEFLEVRFDRDANLARTYFKSGTGFSGSHFSGLADFSETLFDGDAFFTFTQFDGDAFFRRATFRATADFDDAQFNGREDFSKVYFEQGPQFARAKRSSTSQNVGLENPQIQYAITLSLLVFSALVLGYLIRSR